MARKSTKKDETVKVGKAKPEATEVEKKEKPAKTEFPFADATDEKGAAIALETIGEDDEAREVLTAVPFNWTPDHENLGRKDFKDRATFLRFQARKVDLSIDKMKLRKDDLLAKAEEAEKGVDPTQKKIRRAERLKAQLAALEAELEAEGIELDEDED